MTQAHERPNRLADETSPYLLQHAHNPVDWYPWGEEALERARREDKPVLLSVGYSACHWCHVMAHESFEDPETARLMNERFINIKVDREERPDLDKIYQVAHQLLTQRTGGWPLTMFLTPDDQAPFFGGTYFPREPRHGMPAFKDVLGRIAEIYHQHRTDIREQNGSLLKALEAVAYMGADQAGGALDMMPLDLARQQLAHQFDSHAGGFGEAPKFPHPTSVERLLRHWAHSTLAGRTDAPALEMAETTLRCMALGGINDQLGGGFCRYSVDAHWMIPHFEKMLYDNGPLLALYSEAWQATGEPLFRRVAEETAEWVLREMQSPEGGYYASLDAESEGEEGKFYVWAREEVQALLTEEEYQAFAPRFGLDRAPNFEGRWHLHAFEDMEVIAARLQVDEPTLAERLARARAKLFAARERRARPGRDEKILTSWNALMIKGMAAAGRRLDRGDLIDSAAHALDFLRTRLARDGRLLASYKDGQAQHTGYLDDYAFLIDAALELLAARWRDGDLAFTIELAEALLAHFEDAEHGGFYFTADDHETLIQRPRPFLDESTPSGNGVAAYGLARLGHLIGEMRFVEAAERTLRAAKGSIDRAPHAHNALLLALEERLYPAQIVVLRGRPPRLAEWQARATQRYAPRRLALAIPDGAEDLPGLLAERRPQGEVVAYACTGPACSPPITSLEALEQALAATEVTTAG
ncbi:MAG: thioredoxin domain-containing protein [Gammaproteobacteria bacterium]|nr:thioredoxin domain-containing protein [Gammaproteobacteria bacterium]